MTCVFRLSAPASAPRVRPSVTGRQRAAVPVRATDRPSDAPPGPDPREPSRRALMAAAAGAALACGAAPPPARAMIVDEGVAEAVYAGAVASVASLVDFRVAPDGREDVEGVGSGVVWDRLGHIATNYHCVARLAADKSGAQGTRVGLVAGPGAPLVEYPATLVGVDPGRDLAVLRVDAPESALRPVRVGTSADLRVGQSVFAIGNPDGLLHTLSAGVVSGKNRAIPSPTGQRITGCLQTDAQINAGNSGGALLDSAGRMVGMSTATFTRKGTGRGSGVNFAIPADTLVAVVPRLIAFGSPGGAR